MIQIQNLNIDENAHLFKLVGRVLIKTEADVSKIGSVIIPSDHTQQKCMASEVIAIGMSVNHDKETSVEQLQKLGMEVGDTIICQNWATTEVYKDDRHNVTYSVVKSSDIIAILKKDDFKKIYGGIRS